MGLTLLLALALLGACLSMPAATAGAMRLGPLVLLLDHLAVAMAVLVAAISLVVHVYSMRYMADEPGYARFFALLDLMTADILLLVCAGDLLTLLLAWFLVGVVLYFLLGHDTTRTASGRYAFWTFLTYRIGDLPLLAAALLLWRGYGSLQLPELFDRIAAEPGVQLAGWSVVGVAALLVALAAFARSAQFPLHPWLPYSMEGPTPVSALMHAGIVNAGGFLLNRFAPLFLHTPAVLHTVFVVGLVTALMGSALMLTQNDIKKSLGYSTMGQMGFMVMECGLGAFSLAIYHLIAHGLFKATLFLGSGSVIGQARQHDGVPPDEVYTFVVERRPARPTRLPWAVALGVTVVVPALVLGLAHALIAADFVHTQGAIILLFFGWVTGAQVFFSIHRLPSENPWRTMGMTLLSFVIVVVGYTLVGHLFERFLYPNRAISAALYAAAGIDLVAFDALVVLLTVALVGAWMMTLYADANEMPEPASGRWNRVYLNLYALFSREFYVADVYRRIGEGLIAAAKRVNVRLRWV
ncbi:MAG: proton-conducting transporter membrane subunit [Sinobacteraceae bacterium]|nr:proton-conducting transporter membrane subunit [Nevskiaceae bacterium]